MTRRRRIRPLLETVHYATSLWATIRDPRFTVIVAATVGLVAIGSVVYWRLEQWPLLDAVYFSVVTLATVGYGDYAPRTVFGKIFTMVYIVLGVGLLGSFLSLVASRAVERATDMAAGETAPEEPASHHTGRQFERQEPRKRGSA